MRAGIMARGGKEKQRSKWKAAAARPHRTISRLHNWCSLCCAAAELAHVHACVGDLWESCLRGPQKGGEGACPREADRRVEARRRQPTTLCTLCDERFRIGVVTCSLYTRCEDGLPQARVENRPEGGF